jgi:endoglucanase
LEATLSSRRRRALLGGSAGLVLASCAVAAALLAAPAAEAGSLPAGTQFYVDPNSQAARWVASNPGDSRAAAINTRIAQVPSGIWFSNYRPSTVTSDVSAVTSAAAAAGKTPVLVVYEIPNRDCGGASAGGAPDLGSYNTYIHNFAAGLGGGSVVIILEPDSLALQTCLSGSQVTDRDNAIAAAVRTLKAADANAKVYLDAGHSAWNSAGDQASRLSAAGVSASDGIFSNVSNFNVTSNEVSFDKSVLAALGNPGNLHAVVDTSRNGNGPGSTWCDPSGRALGQVPTANTGDPAIDAYLWVKPPGESDGCADAAGTFDPALAYAFIQNGPPVTSSPTPTRTTASPTPSRTTASPTPSRTSASPTPPSSSPPSSSPPASGCHITYARQSEWAGGFVANVTIAPGSAVNGWTVKFTFAGDQHVTSGWNGTFSQSGNVVTITNLSYNGSIPAGGNTQVGMQGTWTSSDAAPTGFTLNGSACS